jgi:hypothetical protein
MKNDLKVVILLFTIISFSFFTSCTKNQRAKKYGGTATIEVPCGMMVGNITWKGESLWYSYIPMPEGYEPVTHTFREESSLGVIEGTYKLVESKCE